MRQGFGPYPFFQFSFHRQKGLNRKWFELRFIAFLFNSSVTQIQYVNNQEILLRGRLSVTACKSLHKIEIRKKREATASAYSGWYLQWDSMTLVWRVWLRGNVFFFEFFIWRLSLWSYLMRGITVVWHLKFCAFCECFFVFLSLSTN